MRIRSHQICFWSDLSTLRRDSAGRPKKRATDDTRHAGELAKASVPTSNSGTALPSSSATQGRHHEILVVTKFRPSRNRAARVANKSFSRTHYDSPVTAAGKRRSFGECGNCERAHHVVER